MALHQSTGRLSRAIRNPDTEKAGLPYVLPYLTDRNSTACYCGLHGIQNHSDIADSYDAKWLQLSRRAFLPDHSGKWVLFYYNLKKILIICQAEIFKFFYIM